MTRQYIGARYVPRFTGEYDNTQVYEALDVVDNGAGTSYIAKIPVPAGTPLTDTEYWFVYGASSGAILDLQNRMSAVESGKQDKSVYDIHSFEGDTIEEKLHSALDYAKANDYNITIICNDDIVVTTPYNLYDDTAVYEHSFATVALIGARIKCDRVIPMFTSDENQASFCITFIACNFIADDPSIIYDSDIEANYINMGFIDSTFVHVAAIKNSGVSNSVYVQSPRFINCMIHRTNQTFFNTSVVWDGLFDGCNFEATTGSAIHITRTVNKLAVQNCCIEGFSTASPIIIDRGALNVIIKNNYFEQNRPHSIEIGNDYIYRIEISHNSFYTQLTLNPIDITGNANNPYIIIEDNALMSNDDDSYLANIEPFSAKSYGRGYNKKLVAGLESHNIYPDSSVMGIMQGWNATLNNWTYNSGDGCYESSFDFYGDVKDNTPFLIGCIRGLSRASTVHKYSLNCVFLLTLVECDVSGSDGNVVVVEKLLANHGNTAGLQTDGITINAVWGNVGGDSNHHRITIQVTCNNGSYYSENLYGRVCDLMSVGAFNTYHS